MSDEQKSAVKKLPRKGGQSLKRMVNPNVLEKVGQKIKVLTK